MVVSTKKCDIQYSIELNREELLKLRKLAANIMHRYVGQKNMTDLIDFANTLWFDLGNIDYENTKGID